MYKLRLLVGDNNKVLSNHVVQSLTEPILVGKNKWLITTSSGVKRTVEQRIETYEYLSRVIAYIYTY